MAPLLTLASAVPMDILMPDGQSRVPAFERNAGGRIYKTPRSSIARCRRSTPAAASTVELLPLVRDDASLGDGFSALDLRVSRPFVWGS